MSKKVLVSFIAVLVLFEILGFAEMSYFRPIYDALKNLWRPDMERLLWVFQALLVVNAFMFCFIFSKGWEGKGIMEGVRFGFYIGIWMGIAFGYGTYAMIAIPYSLAISWFTSTLVHYILAGVLVSLIFGKKTAATA